ncbi:signal peptide [Bradyrhizobium oligotrophicum S58]|uniref:Signal peptide n=1 Tax=Bradyrhizobium oligotrophicum S58 TaxID=1245469 RepID=M4Z8S0_9BRAD|nr:signal peptide [Bradyrhizobium oligotrophicum S58]
MSDVAFTELKRVFSSLLAVRTASQNFAATLADRAFDLFEANIEAQAAHLPALACAKGCPSCCALRVTATAPEIFLLARYIRQIDERMPATALGSLSRRVKLANRATRGLNETERMKLRQPCPFVVRGGCIIHPARPLACRGHASFDRRACALAMAGRDVDVPLSAPHVALRALVQDALRAALDQAGLASDLYELNHGLALALDDPERERNWRDGQDSLAPARIAPAAAAQTDAVLWSRAAADADTIRDEA